jgi:hypothetical protein
MWSQRNGRHVSPAQSGGALQNPAYRPADIFANEGSGATRRALRQFCNRKNETRIAAMTSISAWDRYADRIEADRFRAP